MDDAQRLQLLNGGRAAFGLGLVVAPGLMLKSWVGDDAKLPAVQLVARTMGVRDAAIGLGTLMALEDKESVKRWIQFGIAADAVDCAATVIATRRLSTKKSILVAALAAAAAVTGWQLMTRLD